MVFAVQCPEPRCRKFMLVEEDDRGKVVPCLICKTPIRVGSATEVRDQKSEVRRQASPGDDNLSFDDLTSDF
jgi:hypothetical protein